MKAQKTKNGFWTRLKQVIIHLLGGVTLERYNDDIIRPDWGDDKYLFDFKPMFGSTGNTMFIDPFHQGIIVAENISSSDEKSQKIKPTVITITPKQALKELETIPTNFSLSNLDDKIKILKDKEKLIKQTQSNREVKALLERLENRKKYAEHKEFFDKFDNTTQEKIDDLIKKTGLVMKEADIFIPEFPDDAVAVMKAYTEKLELICNKKPIFYVIAEAKDFRSAYEKRDPILLVQSPFGFYYQILGAWDEEMLLLSEL